MRRVLMVVLVGCGSTQLHQDISRTIVAADAGCEKGGSYEECLRLLENNQPRDERQHVINTRAIADAICIDGEPHEVCLAKVLKGYGTIHDLER